ncbi:D-alanyl-D-alanine carboxypeptidase [Neorhizobium galegae]|uniref:D-alanyl-D-alanine carboxypeptidase n=2 Tax=Neorhizobium galegae TaxID=399 RepID=A0A068SSH2_NEOGA|nr:D-alanyl-D-alanine carboxypeptidase [Neorhizobium galegae]CDN48804.1 D-alanyl-D-alanine carboxypeptidase [Neorhizobium galegae bv. orientalis str. HAMBI 540]CDZ52339.1 D-alanyl-D-alanine carboxypeptidase [Neorhizobium galegae bv. orientalis]
MYRIPQILAFLLVLGASLAISRSAEAGYAHFIYDAKSGKVLASENADEINHPASLTKMMTLYMTFEALREGRLKWDQDIVVTPNAASKIPSKLGVPAGRMITVREAVLGMVVRSANDAAATMGDYLGGSEDRFGEMMTRKARALGMSRTVFRNASGLPDDEQVTTARDMAQLALALIRDFPREYQLFSLKNMEFRGKRLRGHNNLMYRYPGMDGVKTGFTNASGYNIASAVTIDGRRVIGVVMGGKSARKRDDQMAALLDRYVPGNNAASGGLVAFETQKRPAQDTLPLAFATPSPRKEITLGVAPKTAIANLYAAPPNAVPQTAPVPTAPSRMASSQTMTSQQPVGSLWRIQIAAAASRDQASALLEKAMPLLAQGYGRVAPSVESYADSGKEIFRARFVGFADGDAATRACSALQAKAINCFVVR